MYDGIIDAQNQVYTITVTVRLSQRTVTQGGFLEEFSHATNVECDDTHDPDHARITFKIVAQNDTTAQHRAQALVEATANAGGYAGGYQLTDVVTESRTAPPRPASTP